MREKGLKITILAVLYGICVWLVYFTPSGPVIQAWGKPITLMVAIAIVSLIFALFRSWGIREETEAEREEFKRYTEWQIMNDEWK